MSKVNGAKRLRSWKWFDSLDVTALYMERLFNIALAHPARRNCGRQRRTGNRALGQTNAQWLMQEDLKRSGLMTRQVGRPSVRSKSVARGRRTVIDLG